MQESLFSMSKLEDFVPADHPLRAVRALVNEALTKLNGLFNVIYAASGRASIAPEKLMSAPSDVAVHPSVHPSLAQQAEHFIEHQAKKHS